jgi:hypothetical protein
MKKLAIAIATLSVLSLTACHYGQQEAKDTLKRNEEYKGEKAGYSVNRAGGDAPKEEVVATPEATPADSTTK